CVRPIAVATSLCDVFPATHAACDFKHWLRLLAQRTFVRLPLHRPNGANWMSDIEGKMTRAGASERGQRTSFKIVCCNFCKGLFLEAALRWKEYGKEVAL
ncbi:MAG TPA: hypothetical protein VIJ87_15560, partial [Pyrinomonadaceae bacterium]